MERSWPDMEAREHTDPILPQDERKELQCRTEVKDDRWTVSLRLPVSLLEKLYGHVDLKAGSTFSCNFYKISETKEIDITHRISRILSDTPSFHLPEYFAQAEIVEKIK